MGFGVCPKESWTDDEKPSLFIAVKSVLSKDRRVLREVIRKPSVIDIAVSFAMLVCC